MKLNPEYIKTVKASELKVGDSVLLRAAAGRSVQPRILSAIENLTTARENWCITLIFGADRPSYDRDDGVIPALRVTVSPNDEARIYARPKVDKNSWSLG